MTISKFDPVTLEILWNRLVAMVDEAAATFMRTSFSTLVREANDYAVVLTDDKGNSVAQSSMAIPSFIGTLPATVRYVLAQMGTKGLAPGDVLMTNDPWHGTGHIHDITIVYPIFAGERLCAFAAIASHLPDIGGRLRNAGNREIYEEGLQIPLVKLIAAGETNSALVKMIERNVRVPAQTIGDIWAAIGGCGALAKQLLAFQEETKADLTTLALEVQDRSETAMRAAIRNVANGAYNYVIQHDGFDEPLTIDCTVEVKDDSIRIDYTGTSPQLQRAVNVVPIYTFAYTAYCVKALLCPDVPNNDGSFRPIKTYAPPGTVLSPIYPIATGARAIVGHLLPTAVMGALAEVLPNRVWAEGAALSSFSLSGEHQGQRYAALNFFNAGQGANAARKGFDCLSFPSNIGNTPIEVMEALAPIEVRCREIRKQTGGTGLHRGGGGQAVVFRFVGDTPATCSFMLSRHRIAPAGFNGGGAGKLGIVKVNGEAIDTTEQQILYHGDVVEFLTAGGGGFGSALSATD